MSAVHGRRLSRGRRPVRAAVGVRHLLLLRHLHGGHADAHLRAAGRAHPGVPPQRHRHVSHARGHVAGRADT